MPRLKSDKVKLDAEATRQVITDLAANGPYWYSGRDGDGPTVCTFCNMSPYEIMGDHADTCAWKRAVLHVWGREYYERHKRR